MTPGTFGPRPLVEQTHVPIQSEASAGAVSAPGWDPVFSSATATFVSRVFFKLTFATLHGSKSGNRGNQGSLARKHNRV